MTRDDEVKRLAAITRLAIAVGFTIPGADTHEERQARDAFFAIYLFDKEFEAYSTDTFVRACRKLENTFDWFPKKHQLLEACRGVLAENASRQGPPRLALPPGDKPISEEKLKNFLADVKAAVRKRAMSK